MASKVRPLDDRVVVSVSKKKETAGGILLPDVAQDRPQKGEVLAVGPGRMLDDGTRAAMSVRVGDVVLFAAWAGNEIKDLGDDVLIMREADCLGVMVPEEA